MKKLLVTILLITAGLVYAKTINLDQEKEILVELKNNQINLLSFPFVIYDAKISSEVIEDFAVQSRNNAVVVLPSADQLEQEADLLIWSVEGEVYLIKLNAKGNKTQKFTFTSNNVIKNVPKLAKKFETGRIESDIKSLIKKAVLEEPIPGYKRTDIKRQFITKDLNMQKEFFYDGGKYRVETWFLQNTTRDTLTLDFQNFYANGILAIAFEKNMLDPGQVGKMWLIVNKATIADELKNK